MTKFLDYAASALALLILYVFWQTYFETGCWGLSGRGSNPILICGWPGLFVNLILSIAVIYFVRKWIRKTKTK